MQCKLCGKQGKLCRSHIIPEFFYRPIYDEDHSYISIPGDISRNVRSFQKGFWEKLLCEKCERIMSGWETYAKTLFFGGQLNIKTICSTANYFVTTGIDYEKFKLFQMSVLWKAGIAGSALFKYVQLGPHEEALRNMILAGQPGKYCNYGCLISAILTNGSNFDMIKTVEPLRIDGHICYRFVMGGFLWNFVVSRHSAHFPLNDLFLQEDGSIKMMKFQARDLNFLTKDIEVISHRAGDVLSFVLRKM